MSIARALTKRIKAPEDQPNLEGRASTASPAPTPLNRSISTARRIDRAKISLPLELLSTTNVLAYEAPDLHPASSVSSPALSNHSATSPVASNKNPISPLATLVESNASSASSTRSYDDSSDASTTGPASTAASSVSSPVISRETSPSAPALPELNHLSAYFPAHKPRAGAVASATLRSLERANSRPHPHHPASPASSTSPKKKRPEVITTVTQVQAAVDSPAAQPSPLKPAVPQRAPSHTKRTHQALARQRSARSPGRHASAETPAAAASAQPSEETQATARSSAEMFAAGVALDLRSASPTQQQHAPQPQPSLAAAAAVSPPRGLPAPPQVHAPPLPPPPGPAKAGTGMAGAAAKEPHPFGAELAQVQEVAEEFGVRDVRIWDEEEQFLASQGLCKFAAEDYLMEIDSLMRGVFDEEETWL